MNSNPAGGQFQCCKFVAALFRYYTKTHTPKSSCIYLKKSVQQIPLEIDFNFKYLYDWDFYTVSSNYTIFHNNNIFNKQLCITCTFIIKNKIFKTYTEKIKSSGVKLKIGVKYSR